MGSAIEDAFFYRPLIQYRGGRPIINLSGQKQPENPPPPAGHVRFTHTRGQHDIRVTYPDGQTEMFYHGPDIVRILASRGIPEYKIERALDYLWNFYVVYIDCEELTPRPPRLPDSFMPE